MSDRIHCNSFQEIANVLFLSLPPPWPQTETSQIGMLKYRKLSTNNIYTYVYIYILERLKQLKTKTKKKSETKTLNQKK